MFSKTFLIDVAERAFWSYVAALVTLLAAAQTTINLGTVQAAAWAALPAAFAIVKGAVASRIGDRGTAALLPASDNHYRLDWSAPRSVRILNPAGDLVLDVELPTDDDGALDEDEL